MVERQAIFTEDFCNSLRLKLKAGQSISNYTIGGDSFSFTNKDVCYINDFHIDKTKLSRMNEEKLSSLDSAIL